MKNRGRWIVPSLGTLLVVGGFIAGSSARTRVETRLPVSSVPNSYIAGIEGDPKNPPKISESEMFYQLLLLLERDYFDPKIDEQKLAIGAIKGTVNGLWDPLSRFFTADEIPEQKARANGIFSGIGVELRTTIDPATLVKLRKGERLDDPLTALPSLDVAAVLPGSPAQTIGLQVGDRIAAVDGRWIIDSDDVKKIRDIQGKVARGTMTSAQYNPIRIDFQRKAKSPLNIARALDLLEQGTGKSLKISWKRGSTLMTAALSTKETTVPAVEMKDGILKLKLFSGAAEKLAALATIPSTIDLRDGGLGHAQEVLPVLETLAQKGSFGQIRTADGQVTKPLATSTGAQLARKYRLLVDKSVRGASEVLALALSSHGYAELIGGPTAGEPCWIELTDLPNGTGYSLNTGRYDNKPL